MKIAILTHLPNYYSEQRLYEQAVKRGHTVAIVPYARCCIVLDKQKSVVYFDYHQINDVDAIIPRLAPGSVAYGAAIARQLEVLGVYTTASSIAITRSFDQMRTLQVLERSEIQIPKTVFAREAGQWAGLLERFTLPILIQPSNPVKGSGPVLVETVKAAISIMDTLSKTTSFIIQERSGGNLTDIRAMLVGNKVVASIVALGDGSYQATKLTEEEIKLALRAAKAIGLNVCSVQMERTGKGVYVTGIEANPSLENFEKATKRDIAEKIIEYIELNAKRRNKKDRVGA